jgi:D-alanyl-D-alanine carboxypeptidase
MKILSRMKNKKINISLFLFLFIGFWGISVSQDKTDQLQLVLQQKIDSVRQAIDIPAMAFSCVLPSGKLISVASGMKPDQRMLAGSTGKTFFASVALQLVKEKKLLLDEKVATYLGKETWYSKVQNAETITIRQLMNHTAGIEEYYELGDFMQRLRNEPDKTWTPVECIGYTFERPPLFAAGTDWSYADTNYLILGLVIEKILKDDAYKVIQRNFITPNTLKNTEASVKRKLDNQVIGISGPKSPFGISGPVIINGQMIINPQMEWAGGGFISNTPDLARWARIYYDANFLTEAIRTEMRTGVPAKTGKNHAYGLGMQIRPSTLGTSYGHGGWFPGYLTEMDFFPDKNLAVAIQLSTDDFQKLKRAPRFYEMFFAAEVEKHLLP